MEAGGLRVVLCSKSCFKQMCVAGTWFLPLRRHVKIGKKNQALLLLNWPRVYFITFHVALKETKVTLL